MSKSSVVGFLFDVDMKRVLVTRGDAVPEDKSPRVTMSRVLREKTKIRVKEGDFVMFAEYLNPFDAERVVHFWAVKNLTKVRVLKVDVDKLPPATRWLAYLAIGWEERQFENVIMLRRKPV